MGGFIIEKDIPLPPRRAGRKVVWGAPKYPWAKMREGESFLVPGDAGAQQQIRVKTAASSRARKYAGEHYATRVVDGAGIRVWRLTPEQRKLELHCDD